MKQKCGKCKLANGLRKRCPSCKRLVCSDCWGKRHNSNCGLDAKALELCKEMREVDDSHGMYSDHEGDESGPTWHLWSQGYADFRTYCARAIADHEQALFLWRQFVKLNQQRKP